MNFIDLNKASSKDFFFSSQIDWMVDNMTGYEVLSFLDDFSG